MSAQMLFQATVVSFFHLMNGKALMCCLHEIDSIDTFFSQGKDRNMASPHVGFSHSHLHALSIGPVHCGGLQR